MTFETDQQTLTDLNLLGKYKSNSVYNLFAGAVTRGGDLEIEDMFLHPLADAEAINRRIEDFKCFSKHPLEFPFEKEEFDVVQQFIDRSGEKQLLMNISQIIRAKAMFYINHDPEYGIIKDNVCKSITFFRKAKDFFNELRGVIKGCDMENSIAEAIETLNDPQLSQFLDNSIENPGLFPLLTMDHKLRSLYNVRLKLVISILEHIDVYILVGRVAKENNFCFPTAVQESDVIVSLKDMRHPRLSGAISNDIEVTKEKNIFFLTGANMAGKSTLMKSFGIAVYMAHMGFPVAASAMNFRVMEGIYTSINVPDNINLGYSHFYAEVLRVKKVAIEISRNKKLLVIFDELFKGTNVKDAFDATYAVTAAITERKNCAFMVSTHIIEVGQELDKNCENVRFEYLPTIMHGNRPTYTYKLKEGITNDKHGMLIINNEKILEIINGEI